MNFSAIRTKLWLNWFVKQSNATEFDRQEYFVSHTFDSWSGSFKRQPQWEYDSIFEKKKYQNFFQHCFILFFRGKKLALKLLFTIFSWLRCLVKYFRFLDFPSVANTEYSIWNGQKNIVGIVDCNSRKFSVDVFVIEFS